MYDFIFFVDARSGYYERFQRLAEKLSQRQPEIRMKVVVIDELEHLDDELDSLNKLVKNSTEIVVWGGEERGGGKSTFNFFYDDGEIGTVELVEKVLNHPIFVGQTPDGPQLRWKPSSVHLAASSPEALQIEMENAKLAVPVTIGGADRIAVSDQVKYLEAYADIPVNRETTGWRKLAAGKYVLKAAVSSQKLVFLHPALPTSLVLPASQSYAATVNHGVWRDVLVDAVTGKPVSPDGNVIPLVDQVKASTERGRIKAAIDDPYIKALVSEGDPLELMLADSDSDEEPDGLARYRLDTRLRSLIQRGDAATFSKFVEDMRRVVRPKDAKGQPQWPLIRRDAALGELPLNVACEYGNPEIVRILLSEGASAVGSVRDRHTPLMVAVAGGHLDVVKLLLASISRPHLQDAVNLLDEHGNGALYFALTSEHPHAEDIAALLLAHGANATDALVSAVRDGKLDVIEVTLSQGADVKVLNPDKATLLMLAAEEVHSDALPELVSLLVKLGVNPLAEDLEARTAMDYAVHARNAFAVEALVKSSPTYANFRLGGNPLLWTAVHNGWSKAALALIEAGADVNCEGGQRALTSVLAEAASRSDRVLFDALMKGGASVHWLGQEGFNILDLAVIAHSIKAGKGGPYQDLADDLSIIRSLRSKGVTPSKTQEAWGDTSAVPRSALLMPTWQIGRVRPTRIGEGVRIGEDAVIWGGAVIKNGAQIGAGAQIEELAVIGEGATVGAHAFVAMGMEVLPGKHVPDHHVLSRQGLFLRGEDGTLTFVSNGSGIGIPARLVASADPIKQTGRSLDDEPPPNSGAASASADGPSEGPSIDHDEELTSKDPAKTEATAKKLVSILLAADPLVQQPDGGGTALTPDKAELDLQIEHNVRLALTWMLVHEERMDQHEARPLVERGVADFKQYVKPSFDQAYDTLKAAGASIDRDTWAGELAKQNFAEQIRANVLASVDMNDPKSPVRSPEQIKQLERRAGTIVKQVLGDSSHAVTPERTFLADQGQAFWSKIYARLGHGNETQKRESFRRLVVANYKGAPWALEASLQEQLALFDTYVLDMIKQHEKAQSTGGPDVVVAADEHTGQLRLEGVPRPIMAADLAQLQEQLRKWGALEAHELPLNPDEYQRQLDAFYENGHGAEVLARTGVKVLADKQRAGVFKQAVQTSEQPGSAARLEAMEHYGVAITGDLLFVFLAIPDLVNALDVRKRMIERHEDTRAFDESLVQQVSMLGAMGVMAIGRVAEAIGQAAGASFVELLQVGLKDAGGVLAAAVAAQQVQELIDSVQRYMQDQRAGMLTEEDKWAVGSAVVNLVVTTASTLLAEIPVVGQELALLVQAALPKWSAFGRANDMEAQADTLQALGQTNEAAVARLLSILTRDQAFGLLGKVADPLIATQEGTAQAQLQALFNGAQDWFHQAFTQRLETVTFGPPDKVGLLHQNIAQYNNAVTAAREQLEVAQQQLQHAIDELRALGSAHWNALTNAPPDHDPQDPLYWSYDKRKAIYDNALAQQQALEARVGPGLMQAHEQLQQALLDRQDHSEQLRSRADEMLRRLKDGPYRQAWLIGSHGETFDYDESVRVRSGAYSLYNSEHGNSERVDASSALYLKAPTDWAALQLPPEPKANASDAEWSAYAQALQERYAQVNREALLQGLREHAAMSLQTHFTGTTAASQADTFQLGREAAERALIVVQDDSGHTERQLVLDAKAAQQGATYWVQRRNVAIEAGDGDDEILAGAAGDAPALAVDGGEGEDTVSFADAGSGRSLGLAELAQLHNVETLMGSGYADRIEVDAAAAQDPDLDIPRDYHWGGGGADSVRLLDDRSHKVTIGAGSVELSGGNDRIDVARATKDEGALQADAGGGTNTLSLAALAGVRIVRSGTGEGYDWSTQQLYAAPAAAGPGAQATRPALVHQGGHFSHIQSLLGSLGDDDIQVQGGTAGAQEGGLRYLNAGLGEDHIVVHGGASAPDTAPADDASADALVIDGGGGHDSIVVEQSDTRINVDAGHDSIELKAGVRRLELSVGLFPMAGEPAPKASVYAQSSAAQLRVDIAGGQLDLYLDRRRAAALPAQRPGLQPGGRRAGRRHPGQRHRAGPARRPEQPGWR